LRKKINDTFKDNNFIKSSKSGYIIWWKKEIKLQKICSPQSINQES
jgi:hypothetical protein